VLAGQVAGSVAVAGERGGGGDWHCGWYVPYRYRNVVMRRFSGIRVMSEILILTCFDCVGSGGNGLGLRRGRSYSYS